LSARASASWLVRVGDAQVLIGIGAGGIVPLTPLSTPIALQPAAAAPAFATDCAT